MESKRFAPCPGSSPHTWGIPRTRTPARGRDRFIPTYVGHTTHRSYYPHSRSVHPHIRGAYASQFRNQPTPLGSSPHTWGIPLFFGRICTLCRFIPTYVGHTAPPSGTLTASAVHPHIRGAYKPGFIGWKPQNGSSPHTWGIPQVQGERNQAVRFIPTYVGHTRRRSVRAWASAVHPHIRGAY